MHRELKSHQSINHHHFHSPACGHRYLTSFNSGQSVFKACYQNACAPVTLTLIPWPWYMKSTYIFSRCACTSKMNFLGQDLQKLDMSRTDTQTDGIERTNTAAFVGGKA